MKLEDCCEQWPDRKSLPARECGLKHIVTTQTELFRNEVTPRAGVWIETTSSSPSRKTPPVTPRAGVWIETVDLGGVMDASTVTPRAGVWIETARQWRKNYRVGVTPRAGVWIETRGERKDIKVWGSHSPRGSVD